MPVIKDSNLINEIIRSKRKKNSYTAKQVLFVIRRYFYYAIPAQLHGYNVLGMSVLKFNLAYLIYIDIPKRFRKMFSYSSKMFGYTFLPICVDSEFTKQGYNYKPNKKILERLHDVTETDSIYTLMTK